MKPIRDPELYLGLSKVEDLLEEKGWIKGESKNNDGQCIMYALNRAPGSIYNKARDAIYSAIVAEAPRHKRPSRCATVVGFNDDPETSFDDVRQVLRKARESAL